MAKLPKKFCDRVRAKLKGYQSLVSSHRKKDVSEADTITVIKDVLSDVLGYEKYSELTSEHQIRGTFCDLAVQVDGKVRYLIEAKSAGSDLTQNHLRQAVNYGAHKGIEWIILTNAVEWRVYKIKFAQPIDYELVFSFSLPELNPRSDDHLGKLFLLSREAIGGDAIGAFHEHNLVANPYTIAQIVLSEPVVAVIRREMRRYFPDVKLSADAISDLLNAGVLKREVIEGDRSVEAKARLKKASQRLARAAKKSAKA